MIIMFIVMFLPVLALPLFWALPLVQAVPVYIVCLLLSGWMFWIMRDNMKRPVRTGIESLIGKEAEVISRSSSDKLTVSRVGSGVRAAGISWKPVKQWLLRLSRKTGLS
jgi:membrane protein implicated in regulation of membrane protease activity